MSFFVSYNRFWLKVYFFLIIVHPLPLFCLLFTWKFFPSFHFQHMYVLKFLVDCTELDLFLLIHSANLCVFIGTINHLHLKYYFALAGVTQWIECRPANHRVAGLIPSQSTCLGCRPGPWLGVCERQPVDVSLTHQCFSPSLPISLKINK